MALKPSSLMVTTSAIEPSAGIRSAIARLGKKIRSKGNAVARRYWLRG